MFTTREKAAALCVFVTAAALGAACSSSGDDDDNNGTVPDSGSDASAPVEAGDASRVEPTVEISARSEGVCSLQAGVVKCWGNNASGQLGYGPPDNVPHSTPTEVSAIGFAPNMLTVSDYHVCVSDGSQLSCWGDDSYQQLGGPDDAGGCVGYSCPTPRILSGFGPIGSIALGQYNTCVRSPTGVVQCIGADYDGELGASGDGAVLSTDVTATGITNAVAAGGAEESMCTLAADGAISCWGANEYGQLGQKTGPGAGFDTTPHPNPLQVPGVTAEQFSVGPFDVCAVLAGGTVTCWGVNGGEFSSNNKFAGQLGHDPATDPLCSGGFICDPAPSAVAGLSNVREVASGGYATCAIKNDDTVVCWGDNTLGELNAAPSDGDAAVPPYNFTPQVMPGLTNIAHISMGQSFACAVTWDSHVLCWGDNTYGQLGIPTIDAGPNFSPTPVTPDGF